MLKLNKYPPRGFTLIELLVVVLIIGILAAIALPQYQIAVGKARYATLKENLHALKGALDRYYLVNNNYTQNLDVLDVELQSGHSCYVDGNMQSIWCNKRIFGILMEYGLSLGNGIPLCIAYSVDINDRANRICQQETNTSTPINPESKSYYAYRY